MSFDHLADGLPMAHPRDAAGDPLQQLLAKNGRVCLEPMGERVRRIAPLRVIGDQRIDRRSGVFHPLGKRFGDYPIAKMQDAVWSEMRHEFEHHVVIRNDVLVHPFRPKA